MGTDKFGAKLLALSYLMTRDERIESNVEILGQPYSDWSMGQLFTLYCLSKIWHDGYLAVSEFDLPSVPVKDGDRLQNQTMLNNLPTGVSAVVDAEQRGAEGDGSIKWTTPIPGIVNIRNGNKQVMLEPDRVPLEIGYTDASTTAFHLIRFGGVARWPYGHNVITVLTTHPTGIILRWRNYPPEDTILADFAEFGEKIALTRMSSRISWGIHEARPSGEERAQNAFDSFW
jgi:hypothetical protein